MRYYRNKPTLPPCMGNVCIIHLIIILLTVLNYGCRNNSSGNPDINISDTTSQYRVTDSSESTSDNKSETIHAAISDFIPPDYELLDSAQGDLNLDSFPDIILILRKNGEDSTSDIEEHPEKRPLLILTGRADNTWKLAAKTNNAVYCVNCGGVWGDPYMDVVVKNGFFSVEHYGGSNWRWTRTITFRYSKTDQYWFLHKDGHESFHTSEPQKIKTRIYTTKETGKLRLEEFDIYKETGS